MVNRERDEAASVVAAGGVIAFRTDTFYGLGADPQNANAVSRVRELKGREDNKPILLLISDAADADRFFTSRTPLFDRVAENFWPGPLTLIGVAQPNLPLELTAGSGTIGLRLPDDERVRELVRACGGALTATSANVSSRPPARTAAEVQRYFPLGLDLILDDGEVGVDQPSTVLDVTGTLPKIIREGAVTREALEKVLR